VAAAVWLTASLLDRPGPSELPGHDFMHGRRPAFVITRRTTMTGKSLLWGHGVLGMQPPGVRARHWWRRGTTLHPGLPQTDISVLMRRKSVVRAPWCESRKPPPGSCQITTMRFFAKSSRASRVGFLGNRTANRGLRS